MLDRDKLRERCAAGEVLQYTFFWGHTVHSNGVLTKACFSQWYPAAFEIDGVSYPTAEHWMMAAKARVFNDSDTLKQILVAPDPKAAKTLGRQVRNFDDKVWKANGRLFVTQGNMAKFSQNEALGEFLLATGDDVIVEASPRDCIWGIGLGAENPKAQHPNTWRGQNLLGFALMDVREQLRERQN